MSGTYAAVIPLFAPRVEEFEDLQTTEPTLDDTICYLRWRHPEMIETLDDRMKRQRELVLEILLRKGQSPRELVRMTQEEVEALDDVELRLCYHILRDVAYIDSLR